MEYKKPAAVLLAGAFAVNAYDLRYGLQIFTDLPPMSALGAAVSSASISNVLNVPFYSTITDDLIEIPAVDKDPAGQS